MRENVLFGLKISILNKGQTLPSTCDSRNRLSSVKFKDRSWLPSTPCKVQASTQTGDLTSCVCAPPAGTDVSAAERRRGSSRLRKIFFTFSNFTMFNLITSHRGSKAFSVLKKSVNERPPAGQVGADWWTVEFGFTMVVFWGWTADWKTHLSLVSWQTSLLALQITCRQRKHQEQQCRCDLRGSGTAVTTTTSQALRSKRNGLNVEQTSSHQILTAHCSRCGTTDLHQTPCPSYWQVEEYYLL